MHFFLDNEDQLVIFNPVEFTVENFSEIFWNLAPDSFRSFLNASLSSTT